MLLCVVVCCCVSLCVWEEGREKGVCIEHVPVRTFKTPAVCKFKTSARVSAPRPHVKYVDVCVAGAHGDVLNVHTEGVSACHPAHPAHRTSLTPNTQQKQTTITTTTTNTTPQTPHTTHRHHAHTTSTHSSTQHNVHRETENEKEIEREKEEKEKR